MGPLPRLRHLTTLTALKIIGNADTPADVYPLADLRNLHSLDIVANETHRGGAADPFVAGNLRFGSEFSRRSAWGSAPPGRNRTLPICGRSPGRSAREWRSIWAAPAWSGRAGVR